MRYECLLSYLKHSCQSALLAQTGSWSQTLSTFDVISIAGKGWLGLKFFLFFYQMLDSNGSSHPQTMRRQRTEVVVELRKVNSFTCITQTTQNSVFLCISLRMYQKKEACWDFCTSSFPRTKETSTSSRGETCPSSTSVRTQMLTGISDWYATATPKVNWRQKAENAAYALKKKQKKIL